MVEKLPIEKIDRRADCRAIDDGAINGLVDSIASVGLINPIRVRQVGDRWEVIAGSHRLAACAKLGLVDIECIVVSDDDLHAELAMIDENLMRSELSASERATSTARRKAIYLELHPETGHGGDRKSDQVDNLSTRSFAAETATATGKDERTVRRDAERGEKVIPEVINMIFGTKLDTGAYMDKIKKLPPNEQVDAVKRDLSIQRQKDRDSSHRVKPRLTAEQVIENQVNSLVSAWNKAGPEARERFVSDHVETPVFGRIASSTQPQAGEAAR